MNIYEKIQGVSNKIRNIEKNMQVGNGSYGYKAVSDLDVVLAVKDAETEFNLLSVPVKQDLIKWDIIKTVNDKGKETVTYVSVIKMTVKIVDLEQTDSSIEVESYGQGLDSGDKGFGKASTYARKYALLNAYKIATGEDPDAEKSKPQVAETKNEKRDAVVNVLMQNEAYRNQILSYFSLGNVDDLSDKQIITVYKNMQAKGML